MASHASRTISSVPGKRASGDRTAYPSRAATARKLLNWERHGGGAADDAATTQDIEAEFAYGMHCLIVGLLSA